MAGNSIPTNAGQLIGLGNQMLAGLTSLGSPLGITQITPAAFSADLSAFINTDNTYNTLRSGRQTASNLFHDAEEALSGWLQVTRNVLTARYGNRWSTEWAQAGFTNPTTSIPTKVEDRIALAQRLASFLAANPGVDVPSLQVTAAKATALYNDALAAQQTLTTAAVALKSAGDLWDVAQAKLTAAMRGVVKILDMTLAKDDPRWAAFGLNMPSSKTTPGAPKNVQANVTEQGAITVQCDAEPLAKRYRWRMRIPGVESDYRLVARSINPIGLITGVLAGQTVEIIVQAVNDNLQSVPSEPLLFTVPLAAKSTASKRAPIAASAAIGGSNGNGRAEHTNGNHPLERAA